MLESSLKNNSQSHLLQDIFPHPDSKNLRLRRAAFKIPPSHGVWSSPFKRPTTVYGKTVSSLLRESM